MQLAAILACLAASLWEGGRRDQELVHLSSAVRELAGAVSVAAVDNAKQEQILVDIQRRIQRLER